MPFQARPILRIGDRLYCLSSQLATSKLSVGLYHTLLTKLPTKEKRGKFLSFFGYVFERYVNRLFERVYPPTTLARRHYPNLRDPKTGNELIDTIIDYGDSVVIAETKATLFAMAALVFGDTAGIQQKFDDIVDDSAKQLDNAIASIKRGELVQFGLDPARIKFYYPVVITLQFFPLDPLIYTKITKTLKERCLLQFIGTAPLQFISIDDLECLETALSSGEALSELLKQKITDNRLKISTFRNYLLEQVPQSVSDHNPYLLREFRHTNEEVTFDFLDTN